MKLLKKMRSREGFTLVELIVVIMIIGILAATLLPKLLGAPARARDAGRIADLKNISAALESYYESNKVFPSASDCLDPDTTGGVGEALVSAGVLKSGDFPADPSTNNVLSTFCAGTDKGKYYYKPLTERGLANQAYILVADVEFDNNANASQSCATSSTKVSGTDTTAADYCIAQGLGTGTPASGEDAVYVLLGGV